jgi:cephalosporin hydroxylase
MTRFTIRLLSHFRRALLGSMDAVQAYRVRRRSNILREQLRHSNDFSFSSDWFTHHQALWEHALRDYVNRPGLKVLEVGSYEGRSAVWFAQNLCTQPDSRLSCVDLFPSESEVRFDHNMKLANLGTKLSKYRGRSEDILVGFQGQSFDVIYIDGSHIAADVLLDAHLCWPMLSPGGTLIFDDYLWEPSKPISQRPQLAIDLFLSVTAGQWEMVHRGSQILIRKNDLQYPVEAS